MNRCKSIHLIAVALTLAAAVTLPAVADTHPCGDSSGDTSKIEIIYNSTGVPWEAGADNHWCLTSPSAISLPLEFRVHISGLDRDSSDQDAGEQIRGVQFFLQYRADSCAGDMVAFNYFSIEAGEPGNPPNPDQSPFQQEISRLPVPPGAVGDLGLLGYNIGIPFGQPMSACDNDVATFLFTPTAQGKLKLWFRDPTILPKTMFTNNMGEEVGPEVFAQPDEDHCMLIIVDWTAPEITCPPDVIIQCDESQDPDDTGWATATDNCDDAPVIAYSDQRIDGVCQDTYTILRTWTATDECDNESTCVQTITVQDTTPPVITCPADVTIQCDESQDPADTGEATATDNCDPAPVITYTDTRVDGNCEDNYTIQREWCAKDRCDNEACCTQIITVQDTTAPVITCPADVTIQCDESQDPADTGEATATDNCDPAPVVTYTDTRVDGNCEDNYTIQREWCAKDRCDNEACCTQIITVQDTTAPVITCPADVTIQCDESQDPADTGEATATDNCDPDPAITYTDTRVDGNCEDNYTIQREWCAKDRCDNEACCTQIITVQDTTAPVFDNCPGNVTVECDAVPTPDDMSATDNCDPDPGISFDEQRIDGSCEDTYTLVWTWTANDRCGNSVDCVKHVNVQDTTAPTFDNCPGDITVECDAVPPADDVTATDNCDPDPNVDFDEQRIDGPCDDTYTLVRTWTATDRCGNSADCVQHVNVKDTTAPTFDNCPGDVTVECDAVPTPDDVTATDNCDPDPDVDFVETKESGPCEDTYTLVWKWTATDRCGNSAECIKHVFVQDTTDPDITCPSGLTIECDESLDPDDTGWASADDNCDPDPAISYTDTRVDGNCEDNYTIYREWCAEDRCGNEACCTQTITVQDTTDPVITCPPDITIECDESQHPDETGWATATDNCDPDPVITWSDVRVDGNCEDNYTIERTWTATDRCDNFTTCLQTITVQDTTAPVFTMCDDITVNPLIPAGGLCEVNVDVAALVLVEDNCDPAPTLVCERDDGLDCTDPYPCGETLVTWTATDRCDNVNTCQLTVTVDAEVEFSITVELLGVTNPVQRCITFEAFMCDATASTCPSQDMPQIVSETVDFDLSPQDGQFVFGTATFRLPCAQYSCITARDPLHTLRRTIDPIPVVGDVFAPAFTDAMGKGLIGGNLNDDCWIDVKDYGLFANEWSKTYPSVNTACGSLTLHADFTADDDARVWTGDYTFVLLNMWKYGERNCCDMDPICDGLSLMGQGACEFISVQDLYEQGVPNASAGDLNEDGWIDMQDIELFSQGERPKPRKVEPKLGPATIPDQMPAEPADEGESLAPAEEEDEPGLTAHQF